MKAKIGVAKVTPPAEEVKRNFIGETSEVELYLAMSKEVLREGYAEAAIVLEKIAFDKAWHVARFAEFAGPIL